LRRRLSALQPGKSSDPGFVHRRVSKDRQEDVMRSFMIVAAASSLIGLAHAEPDKTLYELQEKCGRYAAETFQKTWGSHVVASKYMREDYENHYNPRLNKCFYLEKSATAENAGWTIGLTLYDLNENKPYGSFTSGAYGILDCQVKGKVCRSEQEWRELAKPFLEEDAPEKSSAPEKAVAPEKPNASEKSNAPAKSAANPAATASIAPHRATSDRRMSARGMSDEPRSHPPRRLAERCGYRFSHRAGCCTLGDPACRRLLRRPMYDD
jgi:hypothetical protein